MYASSEAEEDRHVVVTGIGAITPLGCDIPTTWEALLEGQSGVGPLSHPVADDIPVRIAAEVSGDLKALVPSTHSHLMRTGRYDRVEQFALVAAREAWRDAGFDARAGESGSPLDPRRVAVVVGCGMGGLKSALGQERVLASRGARRLSPHGVSMLMTSGPAAVVGLEIHAQAGVHTSASACASGAEALDWAKTLITSGKADVVMAGGAEAIVDELGVGLFWAARTLSQRNDDPSGASRPFDKGRDGFIMGEGAGMLVLESAAHARARGARVYAELAGSAVTSDGYHMTHPDPQGAEMARAVNLALQDAETEAAALVHWNAHATSTPVGDAIEARAIRTAIGPLADQIVVSATKSMTGHLIGAAGAVEAVFTVLALHHRVAPPTINLEAPDTDSPLGLVHSAHTMPVKNRAALSTSLGFGGHNVALVIRPAA